MHHVGSTADLGLSEPTDEEKEALNNLLLEFKDIFSTSEQDFGLLIQTFHSIDTGARPPFKSCPYRDSHYEEKIVSNEIKKLLDSGL